MPIEGRMEKTESLCTLGPDRLPGPVMSNGARMLLEFNGDGDVEGPPRSFKAVYRFTEGRITFESHDRSFILKPI